MARKPKEESVEIEGKARFRQTCKDQVKFYCDCINHFVAGVDSPFTYLQVSDVQEKLREILDILGVENDEIL